MALFSPASSQNALIRGMNTMYETASHLTATQPEFKPFVQYSLVVCDMLRLHLQGKDIPLHDIQSFTTGFVVMRYGFASGDEKFFTSLNSHGKSLVDYLGIPRSPNIFSELDDTLNAIQEKLQAWEAVSCPSSVSHIRPINRSHQAPATYSPTQLQKSLESLGDLVLPSMKKQVGSASCLHILYL